MNPAYVVGKGLQETAINWGRATYSALEVYSPLPGSISHD